jgi:hypothetical protein
MMVKYCDEWESPDDGTTDFRRLALRLEGVEEVSRGIVGCSCNRREIATLGLGS